jgi:hypothetical protein
VLESYRNRYRYFYKYFGKKGARECRNVSLGFLRVRQLGYGTLRLFKPTDALRERMEMYRIAVEWNKRLDPVRFVETGEEPDLNADRGAGSVHRPQPVSSRESSN